VVTSRPLAGTRKRGVTPEEDMALEKELLADPKERAEWLCRRVRSRSDTPGVRDDLSIESSRTSRTEDRT